MFDRFTDRSRKVMGFARQEAENRGHVGIRSGHILLGLIKEANGVGSAVLNEFCSPESMGEEADRHWGELPTLSSGDKISPGGMMILEFAGKEAKALGHSYVGTEHLLLGVCCCVTGGAYEILSGLGLTLKTIRGRVMALLGAEQDEFDAEEEEECIEIAQGSVIVLAASIADSLRRLARTQELEAMRRHSSEGKAKEVYDALLQEIVDEGADRLKDEDSKAH